VRLALIALTGEMGYPAALSTPKWGFSDVLFKGAPVTLARPLGSYVMENVLFKISFPAEFHAQTAVEAAMQLHPMVRERLDQIREITIETQEPGVRIIDKVGPLANPADRDHCIQYMTAVPLIFGRLTAADYDDAVANDPRIDALRGKMRVVENPQFTKDYYDAEKRFIGNAVQVRFNDGTQTDRVEVNFPIGHRRRRAEGLPILEEKFRSSLVARLGTERLAKANDLCRDAKRLQATAVDEFMPLVTA
jgi:2-methylcitrate dehydratase